MSLVRIGTSPVYVPPSADGGNYTIYNSTQSTTVYYGTVPTVSPVSYTGTIAANASVSLSAGYWIVSGSNSRVLILTRSTDKGYVNHGATASTARPNGYASIEWIGSVEPTNAIDGDTWINTA